MPYVSRNRFIPIVSPPRNYRMYRAAAVARVRRQATRAAVLARLGARASPYGRAFAGFLTARAAYKSGRRAIRKYARRALPGSNKKVPSKGEWEPTPNTETALTQMQLREYRIVLPDLDTRTNHRLSDQMFLKGIKICGMFRNDNPYPVTLHMAIIQYRSDYGSDTAGERKDRFFSDHSGLVKSIDFPATSPVTWDVRYNCNPINSNRCNVITHRKFFLDKYTAGDSLKDSHYMTQHNKYYAIKRRLDFHDDGDTINKKPFFLMFWWQCVKPGDYVSTNNGVKITVKHQIFWKNLV